MNRNEELLIQLYYNLGGETSKVLEEKSRKTSSFENESLIDKANSHKVVENDIRFKLGRRKGKFRKASYSFSGGFEPILIVVAIIVLGGISTGVFFFGAYIWDRLETSLFLSILIEMLFIVIIIGIFYFFRFVVIKTYERFDKKFKSIQPEKSELKYQTDDDIYNIISSTYDTLIKLKAERDRQSKNSFNAALSMIISGILIVFVGVYLLFRKNITEGVLSSSIGAVSNIIGGTIMKFYKDTNNRMDGINKDLFTLNTAKVRYALVLKIKDNDKRDNELSDLIKSIGKI
jgi:hypothetical protein